MTPSPGINYNFVAGAYLVCSIIFGVLLALDKVGVKKCCPVGGLAYETRLFFNRVPAVCTTNHGSLQPSCCDIGLYRFCHSLLFLPMIADQYSCKQMPLLLLCRNTQQRVTAYRCLLWVDASVASPTGCRGGTWYTPPGFPPTNGSTNRSTSRGSSVRTLFDGG